MKNWPLSVFLGAVATGGALWLGDGTVSGFVGAWLGSFTLAVLFAGAVVMLHK